jgi:hypothetical protein
MDSLRAESGPDNRMCGGETPRLKPDEFLHSLIGQSAHEIMLVTFHSRPEATWHFPPSSDIGWSGMRLLRNLQIGRTLELLDDY